MAIVGIAPDPQQSAHGSGARRGADGLGADADCRPADLLLSALAGFAAARRALLPAAAAAGTAAAAAPASDGGFASRRAARLRSLERGAARCAVALRLLVPAVQAEEAPGVEAGQVAGEAPGPARVAAARGSARGTQAAEASAGVSPGSDAVRPAGEARGPAEGAEAARGWPAEAGAPPGWDTASAGGSACRAAPLGSGVAQAGAPLAQHGVLPPGERSGTDTAGGAARAPAAARRLVAGWDYSGVYPVLTLSHAHA